MPVRQNFGESECSQPALQATESCWHCSRARWHRAARGTMLRVGAAAYARPYRTGAQADTHADGHTASEHVQPEPEPELRAAMRLALTRWHHDPPGPGPVGPAAPVSLPCNSGTQACTRTAGGVWRGDAYIWFRIVFRMVQCGHCFLWSPSKQKSRFIKVKSALRLPSTRIYSHSHGLQQRKNRPF